MNESTLPKVTFGMPIRNGSSFVAATLDSILSQDYPNIEVVISDNASTDNTVEIIENYAAKDDRVKLHKNPENIGQNPNFNRVLELADGEFFRWIGMDDNVEPEYATRCVEALMGDHDAIGVSTNQVFHDGAGNKMSSVYRGERLLSPDPARRFARAVWFCTADYRYADPVYCMYRRESLLKTKRLRIVPLPDQVLSVDIALAGRVLHIDDFLCGRRRVPSHYDTDHSNEYQPGHGKVVRDRPVAFAWVLWKSSLEVPMSFGQRMTCLSALIGHIAKKTGWTAFTTARDFTPEFVKSLYRGVARSRSPSK